MTALGFRVKSGRAVAVALGGSVASPQPILRRDVELCDPRIAATRQPFHAGFGTAQQDRREIARLTKIVERSAQRSIAGLLEELNGIPTTESSDSAGASRAHRRRFGVARRASRRPPSGAGSLEAGVGGTSGLHACLVVGSLIDPETVTNPHIRAHANEGRLFRRVVEDALARYDVRPLVVVEKKLAAEAATSIGRPDGEIKKVVAELGRVLGSPWRADEKAAATAAWMALR